MDLPLPRAAGSVTDAEFEELGVAIDEHVDERTFADPRAASDDEGAVAHDVLVVVEVAEELLGVFEDVFRLLEEAGAEEVIKDLPELGVALQVAHVLLFDCLLDRPEVGL